MTDHNDEDRLEDAGQENWDGDEMFAEEEYADDEDEYADEEVAEEGGEEWEESGEELVEEGGGDEGDSDEAQGEAEFASLTDEPGDDEAAAEDAEFEADGVGKRGKKKKRKDDDAPTLVERIMASTPYDVMLWVAALGLLIGIFLMLGEFMNYDMLKKPNL